MAKSNAEIVADIAFQIEAATTPQELKDRLIKVSSERKGEISALRTMLVLTAAAFIEEVSEDGGDREAAERCAAAELQFAAAFFIGIVKARRGEPFSAARFAIVAYTLAELIETTDWTDARNTLREIMDSLEFSDG